uniref:Uncharacterized protein n=1 Tax=Trichogramma kaykai TaxID=54128 RepID=A0ABD2WKF2_9HYME
MQQQQQQHMCSSSHRSSEQAALRMGRKPRARKMTLSDDSVFSFPFLFGRFRWQREHLVVALALYYIARANFSSERGRPSVFAEAVYGRSAAAQVKDRMSRDHDALYSSKRRGANGFR